MGTKLIFDTTNPGKKLTGAALLAWDDVLAGERLTAHAQREVLGCFVQNGAGPMDRAKFNRLFDKMTRDEINDAWDKLMDQLNERAVPNSNGTPSETEAASQDG